MEDRDMIYETIKRTNLYDVNVTIDDESLVFPRIWEKRIYRIRKIKKMYQVYEATIDGYGKYSYRLVYGSTSFDLAVNYVERNIINKY